MLGTPLAHVYVLCVSHRGVHALTQELLRKLAQLGALLDVREGHSDLCRARNVAVSRALGRMLHHSRSVLLMVDDDMLAKVDDVVVLCSWPRADSDHPVRSAVYLNSAGKLAASPIGSLHLTGLGMLAAQREHLLAMAEQIGVCADAAGNVFIPWCTAAPSANMQDQEGRPMWLPDDYSFSLRVGGVYLDPLVKAGHLKTKVLYPSDQTLANVRDRMRAQAELEPEPNQVSCGELAKDAATENHDKEKQLCQSQT